MRSLFLALLLANLLFFALQFDVIRGVFGDAATKPVRPLQVNAERLRIVRDTSSRDVPARPASVPLPQSATPATTPTP